jgi:hypothetical protein
MALSKQDVFNKVSLHLLKQYEKSVAPDGENPHTGKQMTKCMYRGNNGLMCAVGCLIPDELYDPSIEEQTSSSVIACDARLQELFEENVIDDEVFFLDSLQMIHDNTPVDEWYHELIYFAKLSLLNTDVLFNKDAV